MLPISRMARWGWGRRVLSLDGYDVSAVGSSADGSGSPFQRSEPEKPMSMTSRVPSARADRESLGVGDWTIDPDQCALVSGDVLIKLTLTERRLLEALALAHVIHQPPQKAFALGNLIQGYELIGLMRLHDAAGTANHRGNAGFLEQPGLGGEGDLRGIVVA